MNDATHPDLETALKTLWGASQMPFCDAVNQPYGSKRLTQLSQQLEQLVAVRSCGMVWGPHGVGKSLLLKHLLERLPEKRFKTIFLAHSSVTGTDLIRLLCLELGGNPRMRRGDNLLEIRQALQRLERIWPVVVLDEAQNFSAPALEEVRLLSCDRRDTQLPFSLVLVGDPHLLPRLQMGINAPLLDRLSFCLEVPPWSMEELQGYVQARLEQVGIHCSPLEPSALQLLLQAAQGLPRRLNHLAQRAMEAAVRENSQTLSSAHVQEALKLMPWLARL